MFIGAISNAPNEISALRLVS